MPVGYGSRTEYLSLARFCQGLIESLFDYLDGSEAPELQEQLNQALQALQSVRQGDLYRFGNQKSAALGTSEQVSTLRAIWSDAEIDQAIRLIQRLQQPARVSRKRDVQKRNCLPAVGGHDGLGERG